MATPTGRGDLHAESPDRPGDSAQQPAQPAPAERAYQLKWDDGGPNDATGKWIVVGPTGAVVARAIALPNAIKGFMAMQAAKPGAWSLTVRSHNGNR